jgi:hypothetical protein
MSITQTVCICSLRYPVYSEYGPSVVCLALQYFSALFHKRHNFRNTKRVFQVSLQLLSETSFILRRTKPDVTKNVYSPSCKVPVSLVRF